MNYLPYAQLNENQCARAAYLFADSHFGTDPHAYLYEVDKDGEVHGRKINRESGVGNREGRAKQKPVMNVAIIKEAQVTHEKLSNARMHLEALAQSMAEKIIQTETQEVNHE